MGAMNAFEFSLEMGTEGILKAFKVGSKKIPALGVIIMGVEFLYYIKKDLAPETEELVIEVKRWIDSCIVAMEEQQQYDTLQAGHELEDSLKDDEIAVYKVSLQAGTLYRIKVVPGSMRDPQLMLLSPSGAARPYEAYDDDSGDDFGARIDYTPTDSGAYTILVSAVTVGDKGNYRLSVRPLERDGGDIRDGQTLSRSIATPGEQDRFTVSLQTGTTYRIEDDAGYTERFCTGPNRSKRQRGSHQP